MNIILNLQIPILFDVDGVLANFDKKIIDYCNAKNGTNIDYKKLEKQPTAAEFYDKDCYNYVCSKGFCSDLEPLDEGCAAVDWFMTKGYNVQFATAPYYPSPTWCYDRTRWLEKKFNITRHKVHLEKDKRYLHGCFFIDDHVENVEDWTNYWSPLNIIPFCSLVYKHSYNENKETNLVKVTTAAEIINQFENQVLSNLK